MAYFDRRRAEGLTDRRITRCPKRHVANEIYAALLEPDTENPAGQALHRERRRTGIPITGLTAKLGVPYQRLRRLKIGTRADPELEQRAAFAMTKITRQKAA